MKRLSNQAGFTLIELVVVIVILGILAATAAPKFIDLQDDAQTATLEAIEGSMKSAATLVYSKSLIKGNQENPPAGGNDVNVNGSSVLVAYGYPRSNNGTAATTWKSDLLDVDDSEFIIDVIGARDTIVVYPANGTAPTNGNWPADPENPTGSESKCFSYYVEPQNPGDSPEIAVVPC